MDERPEESKGIPCYRDYVIKNGTFVGKFEEMYRDVPDPWGCVEKVNILKNELLLCLGFVARIGDRKLS